ncbi:MAG: diguanylate cyclase [Deltaproteobacteria bacterium]|nr:diguanylate cyclase [Deltaproteobacteria bacterium]
MVEPREMNGGKDGTPPVRGHSLYASPTRPERVVDRIPSRIASWPAPAVTLAGVAIAALVGAVDYLAAEELSFALFYLVPVALVSWFEGRWPGLLVAALSTAVWYLADQLTGHGSAHTLVPLWNVAVRFVYFAFVALVLVRLRGSLEAERAMSRVDPLTGVANVRAFTDAAGTEIARCRRYRHPLSLAYFDVDDFKSVNDMLGHRAGDELLSALASRVEAGMRSVDVVARLGGDEFAVLMPETGSDAAFAAMEKIEKDVRELMASRSWPASLSIGLVTFLAPPESVDALIHAADTLMYAAKGEGKNRIRREIVGE